MPLRKGAVAKVRLVTGEDQEKVFADTRLNTAEQNTLLLSEVVESISRPGEDEEFVVGTGPVKRLGIADRQTILEFLTTTQPGPRYDEIKHMHEACGKEFPLPVSVGAMFQ